MSVNTYLMKALEYIIYTLSIIIYPINYLSLYFLDKKKNTSQATELSPFPPPSPSPSQGKSIPSYIIFYDLETTGLNPYHSKITEIAARVYFIQGNIILGGYDNIPIEKFSSLINPEIPIPEKIVKITGITDEMVSNKPTFESIVPKIIEAFCLDQICNVYFVAHNNDGFDKLFMRRYLNQHSDIRANIIHLDTMRFAQKLLPELGRFNLKALCKHFNIKQDTAHRAVADTKAVMSLYIKLCELYFENNASSFEMIPEGRLVGRPNVIMEYIYT